MLIDGGNVGDSSLLYRALEQRGIKQLDYIVFSHTDEDHVGGLAGVLNYAKVGKCYGSDDERDTKAFNNFKKYLNEQGVSITIPSEKTTFSLGSATVSIWHINNGSDPNDNELIVRIENGSDSFLFTGDIDSEIERLLVDELGATIQSDVLLVPHHGSNTSSSYVFLREVNPTYSIISVGPNRYGHPTEEVLSRYRDLGSTLLRTDTQGNITFTSDSDGLMFSTVQN
jgi:competence protein ComEC